MYNHRIDAEHDPDESLMKSSSVAAPAAERLRPGANGRVFLDGEELPFPRKESAALHLLLVCSPAVVTKEKFAEAVWAGKAMSDDSLTRCIHSVRQALDRLQADCRIDVIYGCGYRLRHTGSSAQAATHRRLLSAAKAAPHITEALMYARQHYQERSRTGLLRAEQLLRDVIVQAPAYVPARIALAECLAASNSWGVETDVQRIEDGLAHLAVAESMDPEATGLHSARGALLDRAWRFDEAEAAHLRALQQDAGDADANYQYGWHLLARGRPQAARDALREAVRLHPYAAMLHVTLARAHAHAMEWADALQAAKTACEVAPGNEAAKLYLAALQAVLQPAASTLETMWQLALSPHASPVATSTLAYALARAGQAQEALEVIGICTSCSNANASTNAMFSAALIAAGRLEAAMVLVQAAARHRCGVLPILLHDLANAALQTHPGYASVHAAVYGNIS